MIYLHIPNSGSDYAFKAATNHVPLSNKRAFYRQPAAKSPEDLRAENALIDCHDHAASLIMLNPGLLSAEPNSAHYIYTNHVGTGSLTNRLANTLRDLGPAQPQQSGNQANPSGWAALQVLSDQHNVPIINPHNKLIQYFPDWHPEVDLYAAPAMSFHINNVRNDANLGATIVRGGSDQDIKGKIWFQRDGFTTIEPNSSQRAAVNGDHVALTIAGQSPDPGLDVTANVSQSGSNVTLNLNFSNSFLRYLGVYAQFLDDKKQPILLAQLSGYPDHIQTNHNTVLDTKTEMFLVTLDPELTILGIPVAAGTSTVTINVPPQARQVRILSSGLSIGNIAPNRYPETVSAGIAMTIIINYAFTITLMAAGAASAAATLQGFVRTLGILVVEDGVELIEDLIDQGDSLDAPGGWKDIGIITAKLLAKPAAVNVGKILLSLVEYVIGIIGAAAAASAIPIIGQIQRAIACIVGVADMIHTTLDLAMSPWTYVTDLVLTHDVSVSLLPDPNNGHFPAQATQYKVTAMFENGTPYVQILALNSRGPRSLPPVVFSNVPLGGKANISVAFLQQGQDDVLLGKGSTGLIDNDASAQPVITIEQLEFPINANTTYQHQQKTTLTGNPAAPVHQWFITKTAPTATSTNNGNQPGDLSLLESITVRQATSRPPVNGYIGYSWRAFSSGIADCSNNAVNQLDQIANLNSLSAQAQTGYVVSRCSLPGGVKIAYSLLSHSTTNFYLDTSIDTGTNLPRNLIRRIQLDPTPRFDDPNSNLAWGKLNFSSSALLLHPAGKLISISVIDHQIETLALPDEAVSDRQANQGLLALRHGGLGNLPGLLSSP